MPLAEVQIPTIRLSPRAQVVMDVNAPVLDLGGQWQQRENPPADFASTVVTGTTGWTEIAIPRPSPKAIPTQGVNACPRTSVSSYRQV